jgi:phage terminase large subunit-like protein
LIFFDFELKKYIFLIKIVRKIDKGYLPGVSLAILTAIVCKENELLPINDLFVQFFAMMEQFEEKVWNLEAVEYEEFRKEHPAKIFVLNHFSPMQNTTAKVSTSTVAKNLVQSVCFQHVIANEARRMSQTIQDPN